MRGAGVRGAVVGVAAVGIRREGEVTIGSLPGQWVIAGIGTGAGVPDVVVFPVLGSQT